IRGLREPGPGRSPTSLASGSFLSPGEGKRTGSGRGAVGRGRSVAGGFARQTAYGRARDQYLHILSKFEFEIAAAETHDGAVNAAVRQDAISFFQVFQHLLKCLRLLL